PVDVWTQTPPVAVSAVHGLWSSQSSGVPMHSPDLQVPVSSLLPVEHSDPFGSGTLRQVPKHWPFSEPPLSQMPIVHGVSQSRSLQQGVAVSPLFAARQCSPPSVLLNAPPSRVPAYTVVGIAGSIARAPTKRLVSPLFAANQSAPPSVLLNTPPSKVPAYSVVGIAGSIARARTKRLVSPLLAANQFLPPSVLLNTPPPSIPA